MESATTHIPGTTDDPAEGGAAPTDQAKDAIKDAAGQAQDTLRDAKDQAKEKAADAGEQAKGNLRDQFDQRSGKFAGQAGDTADDLRAISGQLRDQGNHGPAQLAEQIADRVEQAADYLRGADADKLLADLESFGRQRPWAVVAGGLVTGFLASRVLKASSTDRYHGTTTGTVTTTKRPTAFPRTPPAYSADPTPSPLDDLSSSTTARVPGAGIADPVAAPTTILPGQTPATALHDRLKESRDHGVS